MLVSRLPQIAAAAELNARKAVADTTEQIEAKAKAAAPVLSGALRASISSEVDGTTGKVTASDESAWYQEFGTTRHGPQPFLIPATMEAGAEFRGKMAVIALL